MSRSLPSKMFDVSRRVVLIPDRRSSKWRYFIAVANPGQTLVDRHWELGSADRDSDGFASLWSQ